MKAFVELIRNLDDTSSTHKKIDYLKNYFDLNIDKRSKLWALALFIGKKPPRSVHTSLMRKWCSEYSEIPLWLFEQNYHIVGDLAETIALMVAAPHSSSDLPLYEWVERIFAIKNQSETEKEEFVKNAWKTLNSDEIWVFNKVITGGFRIGVSKNLVTKALSAIFDVETSQMAYLLSGKWTPDNVTWDQLFNVDIQSKDISKPYPFFLAYPIKADEIPSIDPEKWSAEYKWDGIRGQLIYRKGETFLWSRGEELITDNFPELILNLGNSNFVIDGEILVWKEGKPQSFNELQPRITRKNVTKKLLENSPVRFKAYDILEKDESDIRSLPFLMRRRILEELLHRLDADKIMLSPLLPFHNDTELHHLRQKAPEQGAEGLMLKKNEGLYHTGRKAGDMYKWKCEPYLVDAVLLYAQRGHGRRANLYSDFTFAVWDHDKLTPFAKAYSGLTDKEMKEVTLFVKTNTLQTFGPVASVTPTLVFELAFEGISLSSRHKSGIAVRFPRINRWRHDKTAQEASTLDELKMLLKS